MTDEQKLEKSLMDPIWRISNLYKIIDKEGEERRFRPNRAQKRLLKWIFVLKRKRIAILKARQLGFSTLIEIMALDKAIFSNNKQITIIADTDDNAKKLLKEKIKYAYEHLESEYKIGAKDGLNNSKTLALENGCVINASTRARGGTNQMLHISELGKISHKDPERAKEIKTGAIPSVAKSGIIIIESTFEGGKGGFFYNMLKTAMETPEEHKTDLDYWFLFEPWFNDPEYELEGDYSQISQVIHDYFDKLERQLGRKFYKKKRLWYYKTEKDQGDDMKKEYPSTPEEAFEVKVAGAYYDKQISRMRVEGRICRVPHYPGVPVHTFWDLGVSDYMTIWFVQFVGRYVHWINYYEAEGFGFPHYKNILNAYQDKTDCVYGQHFAPHDIKVREMGNDKSEIAISRLEAARKIGIRFTPVKRGSIDVGINELRNLFGRMVIDSENCALGINCVESYHKRIDEKNNIYVPVPVHDWASHCADAGRTGAMAMLQGLITNEYKIAPEPRHLPTSIPSNFQ